MAKSFGKSKKRQEMTSKSLAYIVLIIACILVIAPFTIIISTSFKTYQDSVKIPFSFYMGYLEFESYKEIITDKNNHITKLTVTFTNESMEPVVFDIADGKSIAGVESRTNE